MNIMTVASILSVNFHQLRTSLGCTSNIKLRLHSSRCLSSAVTINSIFQHKIIKGEKVEGNVSSRRYRDSKLLHDKGRSATLSSAESEILEVRNSHCSNASQSILKNKIFEWPAAFIVFDIETTGFSREKDRIIEIAFRDLTGGTNSTFQSLVNPDKEIRNTFVHGIRNDMVSKPSVPRMSDLIPLLLKYVESRKIFGKPVVFVAHNGRTFDFPFFVKEFQRYSYDIPADWLFVDTLPLARKLLKPDGSKLDSRSLQALRSHYNIPLMGEAHRAMEDVTTLCLVLQKMSFDLKITAADLMDTAFTLSYIDVAKTSSS